MKMFFANLILFPALAFGGISLVGESAAPTATEAKNAFVSLLIQWGILLIGIVLLAWLVWWGVRIRRRA